jgi:hypothetical protein
VATLSRLAPIQALAHAAAESDLDIAELQRQLHAERFARQRRIMRALDQDAPGFDPDSAAETFSALTSPELHYVLSTIRGWSQQRYLRWRERTALAALMGRSAFCSPRAVSIGYGEPTARASDRHMEATTR